MQIPRPPLPGVLSYEVTGESGNLYLNPLLSLLGCPTGFENHYFRCSSGLLQLQDSVTLDKLKKRPGLIAEPCSPAWSSPTSSQKTAPRGFSLSLFLLGRMLGIGSWVADTSGCLPKNHASWFLGKRTPVLLNGPLIRDNDSNLDSSQPVLIISFSWQVFIQEASYEPVLAKETWREVCGGREGLGKVT